MSKRIEVQSKAVEAVISNNFKGLIDISPRVGKSKIALDCISKFPDDKILITAPFNPILESWEEEFIKWKFDNTNIKLINQRSLSKENLSYYDKIICDEVHTLSEAQLTLLVPHKDKILGLTGSLGNQTKKELRYWLGLKPIFTYSIEQAINDGIISNYQIILHYVTLDKIKSNIEYGTKKDIRTGNELQAYNYYSNKFENMKFLRLHLPKMMMAGKRSEIIYNSVNKLKKTIELKRKSKRCLIYTTRTSIADKISKSYHSKSEEDNLESFASNKIKKLTVCQMVSMGVTIKNLKHVIVHQLQSSEEMSMQKFLRAMNLEDEKIATIEIVVLKNTQDENWVSSAIKWIPKEKITIYE
jgi:superfamily II DNA or RNA helicase